MIGVEIVAH